MDGLNNFNMNSSQFIINGLLMFGDVTVAKIENDYLYPINNKLLPGYFTNKSMDINRWLIDRCFDSSRTNVRLLKRILNIRKCPSKEMAIKFHAISLTDKYWIKLKGDNKTYRDVSSLSDRLCHSALNGKFEENFNELTPEVTNLGSFEKCWKKENNSWCLKKLATDEELFSEIFVYNLGLYLKFNMVEYSYDVKLDCVSTPNFVGNCNKVFLTEMREYLGENDDVFDNAKFIVGLNNGKELLKQYLDILFLDTLVYNFDRHTGNYGFLRDSESGTIVNMAPNYDNNNSLISREYRDSTPIVMIKEFKELSAMYDYEMPKIIFYNIHNLLFSLKEYLSRYRSSMLEIDINKIELFLKSNYSLLC